MDFYTEMAFKADDLRRQFDSLSAEQRQQLVRLEDMLGEGPDLSSLTPEESEDVWHTAHVTGDPLVDRWEREIAAGQTPDLNEVDRG